MASQHVSKIFIIGGTGVQGVPIVKALVNDKKYQVRVLTRDTSSRRANELLALGNVELLQGTVDNEQTLRDGFKGCDGAFVNIDGFHTGEKAEMYWAIRTYEIAIEEGVKFFVYGSLPYALKLGGYDSKFNAGHMNGKGRIGQWILYQNIDNKDRMGASLFTVAPYIDMTIGAQTVMTPIIEGGTLTWRVPLGESRMPGMDLITAMEHINFKGLATAFENVTGHKAQYIDVSLDEYWTKGALSRVAHSPVGAGVDTKDPNAMTMQQNFTGFWNAFKHELFQVDYTLLDEIYPGRVKNAEDWFLQQDKILQSSGKGGLWDRVQPENIWPVLKRSEDGGKK
ncbi:hypothetical protein J3E69DRAFT_356996 [Trichoderma sp. SZMC 28015]